MRLTFLTLLLVSASLPAAAQETARADDPEKLICKTVTEIGSRLAQKRVCRTKQQWAEDERQSRSVVDGAQKGGLRYCEPGSPC